MLANANNTVPLQMFTIQKILLRGKTAIIERLGAALIQWYQAWIFESFIYICI